MKFGRTAKFLVGAAAYGLASIFQSAAAAPDMSYEKGPYKLWASEETEEKLGWIANRVTQLADMNVLLAAPEDVESSPPDFILDYVLDFITSPDERIADFVGGFPELEGQEKTIGLFNNVHFQDGFVHTHVRYPVIDGAEEATCIIVTPPMDKDPLYYAGKTAFLPLDEGVAISETSARDWLALDIAHKAGFCRENRANRGLERVEVVGGRLALDAVYSAQQANGLVSPGLLESVRAMRALGAFAGTCEPFETMEHAEHTAAGLFAEPGRLVSDTDLEEIYRQVYNHSGFYDSTERAGKGASERGVCRLVEEDPRQLYEIVKHLHGRDFFIKGELEAGLAAAFLTAAENYARDYFKLDEPAPDLVIANPYRLKTSEEIRHGIGWIAERLPEWAGMNVELITGSWGSARVLGNNTCLIKMFPLDRGDYYIADQLAFVRLDRDALDGVTGHCRDMYKGSVLDGEIFADQYLMDKNHPEIQNGHISLAALKAWHAARSIGGFTRLGKDPDHATGTAITVPGFHEAHDFNGWHDQERIYRIYEEVVRRSGGNLEEGGADEKAGNMQYVNGVWLVGSSKKGDGRIQVYKHIARLKDDDPRRLYDVVAQMKNEGLYPSGSLEDKFITEFLVAVEGYARGHFQLDETPAGPVL